MILEKIWAGGMGKFKNILMKKEEVNKTPPPKRERNEESCENGRRVASVAIIVEPVVVPFPVAIVVAIEVEEVPIAVGVAQYCTKCHLCHHPLNTLGVEYDSVF